MIWFKRIFLFMLVNILITVTITFVMGILGVPHYLRSTGLGSIDYGGMAVFCLVWGMGGAFISLLLSKVMAKWMMGVEVVDPDTHDPELMNLVQTVYRLARGAGLPKMPEVGIYEAQDLNAFATGPSRSSALVAVSTGLLRSMDQASVEAVLGHEITHVANGDMVTLTIIQGILNAFVMFFARILAFAVSNFMRGDRDERDRGSSPMVQWLLIMLFEMVLGLLATMVVAAFSRYREYRADAGGARLAGREKMISALQILQRRYETDMPVMEQNSGQPQAMRAFNISGRSSGIISLFATHPPLEDRIRALREAKI